MSIPPLSDREFERYSRQIMLPEWGEAGQSRVKEAKVLIIGCGGLGTAASLYLAGAGIGSLVLADDDAIERSNLSRQVAYREGNVGESKALALCAQLGSLNPQIHCRAVERYLSDRALDLEVSLADIVLDCSDNMATRQAVNKACSQASTPLVAGAAIGWQGQLMVFDFSASTSPCYHCLFPVSSDEPPRNCQSSGVVGPVVGVIGNFQALETLKLLMQTTSIPSRFYQLDGQSLSLRAMPIPIDSNCAVCHPRNPLHINEVPDEHLA